MTAADTPAPRQDPLAFFLDKAVPDAWKAVGGLAAAVRAAGMVDDPRPDLSRAELEALLG